MKLAIALLAAALLAPLTPATPLACASPCEILAHSDAYVAPVTEVASGSLVAWRSLDVGHVQEDVSTTSAHCFKQFSTPFGQQQTVQFDIVGDALLATTDGVTQTCANAVALPDGSQLLLYQCAIHAVMRGALVVTA